MQINIPDEVIKQMITEQVDTSIRKRIKEMQGDYTSKGFIEKLVREVIWDKIYTLCPDIENYIKSEVQRCIDSVFDKSENLKLSKKQLVEQVIDGLLERF